MSTLEEEDRQRVLIIGGVAAGMSAAARLRRLNEAAEIVVFERDDYVSFANCGLPYHISGAIPDREDLLLMTPEELHHRSNLDVRTRHEILHVHPDRHIVEVLDHRTGQSSVERYDKLILAQGASPLRPPIPGIDHPRIHTLRNVADMDAIKAEVDGGAKSGLVIGGGYVGVEMAEALRERGLDTALVEMMDEILPPLDREMDYAVIRHMEEHGVSLHLGKGAENFEDVDGQIKVTLSGGESLTTDFAVLAIGVRPQSSLAKEAGLELGGRGGVKVDSHMRTSDPDIYAVGDMVEVSDTVTGEKTIIALAGPANRQGRIAADHIAVKDSAYSSTQGTSVVKVFEMTAGGTGASEKTLKRTGIPYRKVYVHHSGHAGYYPGSRPIHIKLLFSPDDGAILGAQAVGYDGVDKRIDVFAVALRAGMTVYDLEHLELAYAPPYGSAKDPVNMAGFVASNVLRGDVDQWFAEDYEDVLGKGTILDVRSDEEYNEWHVKGAQHIPITELRERLKEVPADQPVYAYCKSGVRGYLASRILMQNGRDDVRNLSGGAETFRLAQRVD